ncbi:MAG: FHA domain-containing protein [Anaerolineae bacterium]|nr:FHA domain-containing protein [Anaerolineae bacterium]
MMYQEVAMLLVQEGNSPKTQWFLTEPTMIIGRDATSDVQIDDRQVSRRHAEISRTPKGYTIRDLGSKNGTFLNGEAISAEPQFIRTGDELSIALCAKLTFIEDDATAPAVPLQRREAAIKMDFAAKRVWINGQEVAPPLSVAQYTLLELLYRNAGNVVSRDKVVETVWSADEAEGVSEQAIDALARRLRERIGEIDPDNKLFETVRGYGFRLNLS